MGNGLTKLLIGGFNRGKVEGLNYVVNGANSTMQSYGGHPVPREVVDYYTSNQGMRQTYKSLIDRLKQFIAETKALVTEPRIIKESVREDARLLWNGAYAFGEHIYDILNSSVTKVRKRLREEINILAGFRHGEMDWDNYLAVKAALNYLRKNECRVEGNIIYQNSKEAPVGRFVPSFFIGIELDESVLYKFERGLREAGCNPYPQSKNRLIKNHKL